MDAIGDVGFGKGYQEAGKMFDASLRKLSKLGYGVILISHAQDRTITDEQGKEFNRITPTLGNTPRKIVNRFVDLMGYARIVQVPEAGEKTYLYLRATIRFEAGSRFAFTPPYVEFGYQQLVDAIADAIDQKSQTDTNSVIDSKPITPLIEEKDWDTAIEEFKQITDKLIEMGVDKKKVRYAIENHIGKGRTVSELDPSELNTDIVLMIVDDLRDLQVS